MRYLPSNTQRQMDTADLDDFFHDAEQFEGSQIQVLPTGLEPGERSVVAGFAAKTEYIVITADVDQDCCITSIRLDVEGPPLEKRYEVANPCPGDLVHLLDLAADHCTFRLEELLEAQPRTFGEGRVRSVMTTSVLRKAAQDFTSINIVRF